MQNLNLAQSNLTQPIISSQSPTPPDYNGKHKLMILLTLIAGMISSRTDLSGYISLYVFFFSFLRNEANELINHGAVIN
jgi:hypothetical protein